LIGRSPPNNLDWSRNRSAERTAPAFSSVVAADARLDPGAMITATGFCAGPAPFQPWMK
jgi:hypothetical protein